MATQQVQTLDFKPAGKVVKAWMESNAFVRGIVGPLGSGKTAGAVVEILRRSQMQKPGPDGIRRVRVACIRNTFSDLKTTTIKSWEQWCPTQYGKMTLGTSPIIHRIKTDDLDLEVLFVPLDREEDVRKLLSLELTFGWIDECREIPKSILDALTGRVGRYPSRNQGGCTWSGILLTSNPSDTESWLYKVAENPPEGWEIFRQPSGLSPDAENLMNLPENYYQRMLPGKDPEWIKVYVDGEFGFLLEGKPVYPSFRDSVHVSTSCNAVPGVGLTLGADWGLTPAAIIGQQLPDGRLIAIDEFVCEDSGIVRFAEGLTRYLKTIYPDNDVVAAWGDPAGTARGPDERTVFEIMNQHTPWRWRPTDTNEPTIRIESVSLALDRMVDGKPGLQISPRCRTLRKGFSGGYHFAKVGTGNGASFMEVPKKNKFSHPHDALQYLVLGTGGASVVLNRDKRKARPAVADGVDAPIFGEDAPRSGPRAICGNGRPAHMGPVGPDNGQRRRLAREDDSSIFL